MACRSVHRPGADQVPEIPLAYGHKHKLSGAGAEYLGLWKAGICPTLTALGQWAACGSVGLLVGWVGRLATPLPRAYCPR